MLLRFLFVILISLMGSSAYLYYLINININSSITKTIELEPAKRVKVKKPSYTKIPSLPAKIKKQITKEKSKKIVKKVSDKSDELLAEVGQKIFYNRETKIVEKKDPPKVIKNIKKKEAAKAPSVPIYKPEELSTGRLDVDGSEKFSHYGYTLNVEIDSLDLVALASSVIKDVYYIERIAEIVPKELDVTVEQDDLFEVVLDEEKTINDELTYKYSANKKDFKIIKTKEVQVEASAIKESAKKEIVKAEIMKPVSEAELKVEPKPELPAPLPRKKIVKKKEVTEEESSDDLVYFDYSKETDYSTAPTEPAKVKKVYPEYSGSIAKGVTTQKTFNKPLVPEKQIWKEKAPRIAKNDNAPEKKTEDPGFINFLNKAPNKKTEPIPTSKNDQSTVLEVEAMFVSKGDESFTESPFEVEFIDNGERKDSAYEGFVKVDHILNNNQAIRRAKVVSADFIPTIVDFSIFKNAKNFYVVPLVSRSFWYGLIDKYKVDEFKAALLIEQSDDQEVFVERVNKDPLYLDDNFEVVDEKNSKFQLYLDLNPGNITLRYDDGEYEGFKDVHISGSQIYFERARSEAKPITLMIKEKEILGITATPLDISEKKIQRMYLNTYSQKKGVNVYRFPKVLVPESSRTYLHLNNQSQVDLGVHSGTKSIEVPSKAFKDEILNKLDISKINGFCVTQINLPLDKKIYNFELRGEATLAEGEESRTMHTEYHAFDTDGVFYKEVGDNTQKIFVIGEGAGIINFHLRYEDDSEDHLLTVCDSTYTVEQL